MKPKHILIIILIVLTSCSLVIISKNIRKTQSILEGELQSTNTEIRTLQSQVEDQSKLIATLTKDNNEITDELTKMRRMNIDNENAEFDSWNYEINFVNGNQDRNTLTYFVNKSEEDAQIVNIIGNNFTSNGEVSNLERLEIKGLGENEHVKFSIFGDVYEFSLYSLNYLDSDLQNAERVLEEHIGDVSDTEIIVETTLPEGLPIEVISWKDADGNLYEEFLSYDGLGVSGRLIISY